MVKETVKKQKERGIKSFCLLNQGLVPQGVLLYAIHSEIKMLNYCRNRLYDFSRAIVMAVQRGRGGRHRGTSPEGKSKKLKGKINSG